MQKSDLSEAPRLDVSTFTKAVFLLCIENQANEFGELKKVPPY